MHDEDDEAPESTPPERRPMTFISAAMWTLLVVLLFGLGVAMSESARSGAIVDPVTLTAARLLAISIAVFGIARLHEPLLSLSELVALRRPSVALSALAALFGAAASPPAMWIEAELTRRVPPPPSELQLLERLLAVDTLGRRITLLVAFAILVPICEELFVRGALFTTLKRGRAAQVVVAATALFDVLGGLDPRALFPMLAFAVCCGWVRAQSGSVVPGAIARVAFFTVQVAPLAIRGHDVVVRGVYALAGLGVASLTFLAILALGRGDPRAIASREADG